MLHFIQQTLYCVRYGYYGLSVARRQRELLNLLDTFGGQHISLLQGANYNMNIMFCQEDRTLPHAATLAMDI
jgi:hypothetical protein